jgi:hypothetical protein
MKHRFGALLGVLALALTLAGSAFAFDCIRVSSSLQGLKSSTRSGNRALFDLSSGASAQQSLGDLDIPLTVDHLEDSPVGAALFGAAADCGIPVGD